jgi:hypothetical protein
MYGRSRVSSAFSKRLLLSISFRIPPLTVHYGRISAGSHHWHAESSLAAHSAVELPNISLAHPHPRTQPNHKPSCSTRFVIGGHPSLPARQCVQTIHPSVKPTHPSLLNNTYHPLNRIPGSVLHHPRKIRARRSLHRRLPMRQHLRRQKAGRIRSLVAVSRLYPDQFRHATGAERGRHDVTNSFRVARPAQRPVLNA